MEDKQYFSTLNGYYVKDSDAREALSEIPSTYATKTELEGATDDITSINNNLDIMNSNDTIFLGDSYADGTTYESGSLEHVDSWCEHVRKHMGLTEGHYYIFSLGGGGFAHVSPSDKVFIDLLEENIDTITDKNKIKNIVVCAGYNDNDQTYHDVNEKIEEFYAYCKTMFPNATLYLGMIGGNSSNTQNGANIRSNLLSVVLRAYMNVTNYGGVYLSGVENFSHNFKMFDPEGNHPTNNGYKLLGKIIYNAIKTGYGNMYVPYDTDTLTLINNATVNISGSIHNNNKTIILGNIILNDVNITVSSSEVEVIGTNTDNNICKPNDDQQLDIPCDIWYKDSNDDDNFASGKLQFMADGSVIINSTYFAIKGGTITSMAIYPTIITAETLIS